MRYSRLSLTHIRLAVLSVAACLYWMAPAQAQSCDVAAADIVSITPLSGTPFSAIPTKDGCTIFVSLTVQQDRAMPGHIAVLGRAGGKLTVLRDLAVSARGVAGMAMSHDGKLLAVTDSAGVLLLDTARLLAGDGTPVAVAKDPGGVGPQSLTGSVYAAISPDDKLLFISDEATASISVYDLAKLRSGDLNAIGRIPVGNAPVGLVFSPDGRKLYATSEGALPGGAAATCPAEGGGGNPTPPGVLTVVDVARAANDPATAVLAKVPGGCDPVRVALSTDGSHAYVTARGADALEIFDTAKLLSDGDHALVATMVAGKSPVGIAVAGGHVITADSNRFAPPGRKGEWLSVIDPATAKLIGNVPAGLFPRELFVTADSKTLLVTNFSSSSLALVDLARLTPAYFAQQKTAKDADDMQQAHADAVLAARIASAKPTPATEAALRKFIAGMQARMPDYDDLAPAFTATVRGSAAQMEDRIAGWGALQSVTFKTITPQGVEVYIVAFEHQKTQWAVNMGPDGKVAGIGFGMVN